VIVRNGLAATFPVTFESGSPDGDVTWKVLGPDGTQLATGTITPGVDAVSINIPLSAPVNTLDSGSYISYRDLTWEYEVLGAVENGEQRYSVERRLPVGVTYDGVRRLFGVSISELPDDEIPLTEAYLEFISRVTQIGFDAAINGGLNDIRLRNAIEAQAALMLLPSMPVRVMNTEGSGTNTFKRQEIDWLQIGAELLAAINTGVLVVIPTYDITAGFGALLILAGPTTDAITGATNT
jgi:hypothetical protein